ncbi:MAG: DMT family transporter [Pseudomonadota bacterium]
MTRSEAWGHAAGLLFAAVISVSFSLGGLIADRIDPAALTAGRFLLAALVIGAFALPQIRAVHLSHLWRYLLLGALLAAYFISMFEALRLTDPVSTGAIFTLTPLMSAVFGWVVMRQVTTGPMAMSLLLAAGGALWVTFRGDMAALLALDFGAGERLFLAGCALHALYTPLIRRLNWGEPVVVLTFGTILGGCLVASLWGAEALVETRWQALPPLVWIAFVYLGVMATAFTFFLLQFAAMRLPASKAMAYGYLVPGFVILWEGLLGHGWVALPVWAGLAATLTALALLLRS